MLEGVFVRYVGVGTFGGGYPCSVAVRDDVISVGSHGTLVLEWRCSVTQVVK